MTSNVVEDPAPLQPDYLPRKIINRKDVQQQLKTLFNDIADEHARNIHIFGPKGTGKTHFTHLAAEKLPSKINTCYVPCTRFNTQYKALRQIAEHVSQEDINDGHHTSKLQRLVEDRTTAVHTVIILDDLDFLLLNDGENLLYQLSRINTKQNISLITVSSNTGNLKDSLEERTYSSLQPRKLRFKTYTAENIYRILVERSRKALAEQSLHREAVSYIASQTRNTAFALKWLKTAARNTSDSITESQVRENHREAYTNYTDLLLSDFSQHHHLLLQAIQELAEESTATVQAGTVYKRYQDLAEAYDEDRLTDRRISTYLKHLELLHLIEADYHYGGQKGKTREITLKQLR